MNVFFILIGLFHLLFAFFLSIYGFISTKNWFDKFYIYYNYLVLISWTFFNGECFITYMIKKYENPKYIAGTDSTDLSDMSYFIDKNIFSFLLILFIILNTFSIFLVNRRNNYISLYLSITVLIVHNIYVLFLRKMMNSKLYYQLGLDKIFEWFQLFTRLFFIYVLILTISHK